jgi:hypothetical protein
MLQYSKFPQAVNLTAPTAGPAITGRRLSRLIKQASAADRALLAHKLEQGEVLLVRPTRAQATMLAHASPSYVGTIGRLTADERLQLARGELSLSRLHNNHRYVATDTAIDRIVAKLGAERVMAALDRMTAPSNGVTP